jgi:hypothetical protein
VFWATTPCSPLKVNRLFGGRPEQADLFAMCFVLLSCLADSSTLEIEVTCSYEMSVDFQRTKWRYIPKTESFVITAVRSSVPICICLSVFSVISLLELFFKIFASLSENIFPVVP